MHDSFISSLLLAFNITAPIFLLVILGYGLRKSRFINDHFIESATRLVFNIGLPVLLFLTVLEADLNEVVSIALVSAGLVATVVAFTVFWISSYVISNKSLRGIFVQGAFRGNLGIIGLAYCFSAYGELGIASAALYTAVITLVYNVLSVIVLATTLSGQASSRQVFFSVLKNPLILAISFGFIINALSMNLPEPVIIAGNYVSAMALPLALLCIGGSMSMKFLTQPSALSVVTTAMKLLIAPGLSLVTAFFFPLNKTELGIVFLMSAAPTASASYIMVRAMQGDGKLAASIVVLSTLLSVLTVSIGMAVLTASGII